MNSQNREMFKVKMMPIVEREFDSKEESLLIRNREQLAMWFMTKISTQILARDITRK